MLKQKSPGYHGLQNRTLNT